jgi:hypothetical protein
MYMPVKSKDNMLVYGGVGNLERGEMDWEAKPRGPELKSERGIILKSKSITFT